MTAPEINPAWRTDTVLALCRAMREEQAFDALPILADALEDADCGDEALLARLRGGPVDYLDDARLVAVVLSDEGRESVAWLEALAAELGDSPGYGDGPVQRMDYRVLMEAARDHLAGGEYLTQVDSESWRDAMYHRYEEFWEHYRVVTGVAPADRDTSFFSCSC